MPRPRKVETTSLPLETAFEHWDSDLQVRHADKTRATYLESARSFRNWLSEAHPRVTAVDQVTPTHVRDWLLSLREAGKSPATQGNRYRGLRQFWRWATTEDLTQGNPMANTPVPRQEEVLTPVLSPAELSGLLRAAAGKDFESVRDKALLRLLIDTGMRRSECAGLKVEDLDWVHDVAIVMGKGSRERACPFGKATAADLRRYLRARENHPHHYRPELWLGYKGPLGSTAILLMLRRRAKQAGIRHRVFVHQLRHTWASEAMKQGLSEGDLMKLGGWRSRDMLSRYGAAAADERAQAAYRSISLGDRI